MKNKCLCICKEQKVLNNAIKNRCVDHAYHDVKKLMTRVQRLHDTSEEFSSNGIKEFARAMLLDMEMIKQELAVILEKNEK